LKPRPDSLLLHQKIAKLQQITDSITQDLAAQQAEEQQLIAMLQSPKQQEKGFRMLMQTYQERLYWHIRAFLPQHQAADEVLQNTFVKVFRGINSFRQQSRLYTWLYKIATNEALTYIAKEKRYQNQLEFDDNFHAQEAAADAQIDAKATLQLLQKAITSLPDKQKIVFNLRYYQEMPYEEMSQLLSTSVGALKASYHHAVKKVEAFLREQN
jgi:RNA polymerase sigma-70 factor (ECF subfamily)